MGETHVSDTAQRALYRARLETRTWGGGGAAKLNGLLPARPLHQRGRSMLEVSHTGFAQTPKLDPTAQT